MGSLPNLNDLLNDRAQRRVLDKERELERERIREIEFPRNDKDKADIFLHFTNNQVLTPRQHYRHSLTTRRVHRTRSSGATHHIWDDPMIEYNVAYSPISTKGHRVHHQNSSITQQPPYQIQVAAMASRRRDSINSSIGATSIRRLLAINRNCRHSIPIDVRNRIKKNYLLLTISHCLVSAILIPMFGFVNSNAIWTRSTGLGSNIGSILLGFSFLLSSIMCLLTKRCTKKFGYIIVIACNYGAVCLYLAGHLYPSVYTLPPAYLLLGLTLGPSCISKWNLLVYYGCRLSCGQQDYLHCSQHGSTTIVGGNNNSNTNNINNNNNTGSVHKLCCNRNERIRRLSRCYKAAQDIGIVLGAIAASFMLSNCSINNLNNNTNNNNNNSSCFFDTRPFSITSHSNNINPITGSNSKIEDIINSNRNNSIVINDDPDSIILKNNSNNNTTGNNLQLLLLLNNTSIDNYSMENNKIFRITNDNKLKDYTNRNNDEYMQTMDLSDQLISSMFRKNFKGERICGADACPLWIINSADDNNNNNNNDINNKKTNNNNYNSDDNASEKIDFNYTEMYLKYNTNSAAIIILLFFYMVIGFIAFILTCFSQQIDNNNIKCENFLRIKDTLIYASPMAFFIGAEQGYVLGDFTKAFVSCSLGPQKVAGALIGMGLMQCIVSYTLSMLLRHTKRLVVLIAGFFFHGCILLTICLWIPSIDDSALFYVIAASWGACNGMWETLQFTLISLMHTNRLKEISSYMIALKFFGLSVTFLLHGILCEKVKILSLGVLLLIAIIPYSYLEMRQETIREQSSNVHL